MIPSPPAFNVTLMRGSFHQRKAEDDKTINDRVSYLLSAFSRPPNSCVIVCLHNSEPVVQVGPSCGLVAISMASKLLHGQILEQASPSELLLKSRQLEFSKRGEIFSAENLLQLSLKQLQCSGTLISFDDVYTIVSSVLKGDVTVFPYDCDKDHTPCKENGHRAHWALSVGCAFSVSSKEIDAFLPFCDNKIDYYLLDMTKISHQIISSITRSLTLSNTWLFCRHGKTRHIGLWPLKDIVESNANLLELGQKFNPSNSVIPNGGMQHGLCGKAVLLKKKEQNEMK